MSKERKAKVIHVENLVIHANNVEFMRERRSEREEHERDPWEFLWGRRRQWQSEEESSSSSK